MEKGEKSSPSPGPNLFDAAAAASLLGTSPFSPTGLSSPLPYAHLPHPLGAFSMLGHHPAFPVSSLFGRLGDGLPSPLTSPSALTSSLSPTSASKKHGTSSSSSKLSPSTTVTKTTSSTSTPHSNSSSNGLSSSGNKPRASSAGSIGHRGRPRKQLLKPPSVPLTLVDGKVRAATSLLSPEILERKRKEAGISNGVDTDESSEKTSQTNIDDDRHRKSSPNKGRVRETDRERKISPNHKHPGSPPSPTKASSHNRSASSPPSPNKMSAAQQATIHIDGLKKKLIADQIRQRMQNKVAGITAAIEAELGLPVSSKPRGRGRSPRNSHQKPLTVKEIEEQRRKQEELKQKLEAELKQQQMALRMKKANAEKESPGKQPVQKGRNSSPQRPTSASPTKVKPQQSKLAQVSPQEKTESSKAKTSEPIVAKFKSIAKDDSSASSDDDDSDSDSDSDSGSGSSSDTSSNGDESKGSETSKRSADDSHDDGAVPVKRRRVQLDESELRVPVEHGWKRQTNIHTYGRRGIVGEVWYFAPCGRKLKTIPDVMRYLDRNKITDLGRDNFSFNTKVNVGEFYEARGGQSSFVKLNETEINDRLSATVSRRNKKIESQKKQEKLQMQQMLAKQIMEAKMKQKMEQQEMARKVAEMQYQKRLEKQRQKEMVKRAKQLRALEKRKQKEHLALVREQERLQRQEQLKRERDMRAQQILEQRRKEREDIERQKYVEAVKRAQEKEMKRQQSIMMKEQERERRRQHMLLLKALEQRKKQEEKDKQREEKFKEKRLTKEKKMEQRKMEFILAQELKKPREDMELKDARPLPDYPRIPGCYVDGNAFADILMVLEFLRNFGDALGFDKDTLPTLKSLQDGILTRTDEDGEDYISLTMHLLRYALDEPGVPNPREAVTKLGQKITDMDLSETILPEVLRVFMIVRNGKETELSEHLKTKPIEAFTVTQKAAVLAFLCNELICGKTISSVIEKQLDHMGDIRRDKWVVEGKLRRLRVVQAKKFNRPISKPIPDSETSSMVGDGEDSMATNISSKVDSDDDDKDNESGNDSDVTNSTAATDNMSEAEQEDDPITLEECEKKIEKLQKQHAQYRAKVFEASHKIRAVTIGQDRYKRRYWILPCAGGVYIEGLESGEVDEEKGPGEKKVGKVQSEIKPEKTDLDTKPVVKKECHEEIEKHSNLGEIGDSKDNVVKHEEKESFIGEPTVKKEQDSFQEEATVMKEGETTVKTERCSSSPPQTSNTSSDKCGSVNSKSQLSSKDDAAQTPSAINSMFPSTIKVPEGSKLFGNDTNLFLQEPSSNKLSELCKIPSSSSDHKTEKHKVVSNTHVSASTSHKVPLNIPSVPLSSSSSSASLTSHSVQNLTNGLSPFKDLSPPKPPPAHSHKPVTHSKPSFMSIDTILKKEPGSSHGSPLFSPVQSPSFHYGSDPMGRNLNDSPSQKPWFSILPRIPCDDMSLTRGQHQTPMSPFASSPFGMSPSPFRAFPVQSPTFASFQMGQLFGSPSDMNLSSACSSVSESPGPMDHFKVPEAPGMCGMQDQEDPELILKKLQGEARPIPEEMQKGWWKVTDSDQLRLLQRWLHPRGIREKSLQKSLQKYFEYCLNSCTRGDKEVISLESSDSEDSESEDEKEDENEKKDDTKEGEEKKEKDGKEAEKDEKSKDEKLKKKEKTVPVIDYVEKTNEAEALALEEVETICERIASASLQVKGWKLPVRTSAEESEIKIVPSSQTKTADNERYPMEVARERLRYLEANIERRYLKPPLSKVVKINLTSLTTPSTHDDEKGEDCVNEVLPAGLQTWRNAVTKATSPAQILLCVMQLNNSISWEKSIMKVLCQICRKDDNEAELLLCDGCDRGYHTYCFKPKLEQIPDGDWYCFECISKAVGESCCIVCGRRTGRLAECDSCPRAIHIDCLDPPLPRVPRKYFCAACQENQKGKKRGRKSTGAAAKRKRSDSGVRERKDSEKSERSEPGASPEKKKSMASIEKEKRKQAEASSDMVVSRLILTEMEKHEEGWPFLQPVNFKQFPSYKKFIKHPMDFSTMKNKLRDNAYKTRSEFAADAHLIFENCRIFNEDESEVGKAGHAMRKFFDKRWKELLLSSPSEPVTTSEENKASNSSQSQEDQEQ